MGLMSGLFKALGFESDSQPKKVKKTKNKASYKLNKSSAKRLEEIDGIPVYYPENIAQIKEFVAFVKDRKAVIISTESCKKEDVDQVLNFLKGFTFGVNARLVMLDEEKLYLILPEGMEVEE